MVIKQNWIKGTLKQPGAHANAGVRALKTVGSLRAAWEGPLHTEVIQKKTTTRNSLSPVC